MTIKYFSGGWFVPEYEAHLQDWMTRVNKRRDGRLLYQSRKYETALTFCKSRRFAVDIGAHVGLWSWQMAKDFAKVVAFEPIPIHRECYARNMQGVNNVTLYAVALGDETKDAFIKTRTPNSSGDTGIEADGIPVQMRRLDEFELVSVDFIKVDCEGFEVFVMKGATDTLKRCKPCVIVEQKPETGMAKRYGIGVTDAVKFLESLGAKTRAAIQGDYIMTW